MSYCSCPCMGELELTVRNTCGSRPFDGVPFEVVNCDNPSLRRVQCTDAGGCAVFEGLPCGNYFVRPVTRDNCFNSIAKKQFFHIGECCPSACVVFYLDSVIREGTLAVSVVRGKSNIYISGVTVNLLDECGRCLRSMQTDCMGKAVFCNVPVGDYVVESCSVQRNVMVCSSDTRRVQISVPVCAPLREHRCDKCWDSTPPRPPQCDCQTPCLPPPCSPPCTWPPRDTGRSPGSCPPPGYCGTMR
ncbi:MSCRAMM family protein [Feifania hominis]|uniref:Prealbumin-like fold domain-containing protein n=1 Tax=Feifania hominis TaxID=2763660 RepID=A0A926HUR2_9FIRM|nr:hypothetical protein [Feifania hominis]MBC8536568.1 hypothetical protein [Feifania hominis]